MKHKKAIDGEENENLIDFLVSRALTWLLLNSGWWWRRELRNTSSVEMMMCRGKRELENEHEKLTLIRNGEKEIIKKILCCIKLSERQVSHVRGHNWNTLEAWKTLKNSFGELRKAIKANLIENPSWKSSRTQRWMKRSVWGVRSVEYLMHDATCWKIRSKKSQLRWQRRLLVSHCEPSLVVCGGINNESHISNQSV